MHIGNHPLESNERPPLGYVYTPARTSLDTRTCAGVGDLARGGKKSGCVERRYTRCNLTGSRVADSLLEACTESFA